MMSSSLTSTRMSREEFKKAKELEELRKSGAAPPEVDPEGKMINPHIPQYISQSPWYLNNNRPGLRHQTLKSFEGTEAEVTAPGVKKASFTEYYQRGKTAGPAPTKFVAGSCTNCGSSTHTAKDCVERPRKKGAALTGENIQAPEMIQKLEFNYDAKRDRWNGYDTREYSKIIRRFELTEMERKKKNLEELDAEFELARQEERKQKEEEEKAKATAAGEASAAASTAAAAAAAATADGSIPPAASASSSTGANEADEKLAKDTEARRLRVLKKQERLKKAIRKAQKASSANNPGGGHNDSDSDSDSDAGSDSDDDEDMKDFGEVHQKKDTSARMTVRNLRIREDRAKYLLNLDINSAYYDPKTRSMRENPYENKDPKELMYAGDNFVRKQGLTGEMQAMQSFVWESNERGNEGVHVQALPSQAEKLFQEFKSKKEELKNTRKAAILEKYGDANGASGDNQMKAPKELLMPASESYTEYDETGKVIRGVEQAIPRTKYVEDQYENGHKAIWGSFWKAGSWGYACCHQTIRHAICTGEAGKEAAKSMADQLNSRQSFKEVKEAKEAAAASDANTAVPPAAAAAAVTPAASSSSSSSAVRASASSEPVVKSEFEVDDEDARMLAAELARKRKRRDDKRKSSRSRSRSNSASSSSGSDSESDSSSSSGSDSSSSSSESSSSSSSSSSSESDDDADRKHRKKRSSKDKKKKKRSSRSRRSRSRSRSRSDSRDKKRRKKEDNQPSSSSSHISAAARINSKGYNSASMDYNEPSQEEMDSYLLQKHNKSHEDPLLNMPKDTLLEQ